MYTITFYVAGNISTKLLSYLEFVSSGQKKGIQSYVLNLLEKQPQGLSNRQIHQLSGIEIGSLTNPLKTLCDSGKIIRSGVVKNTTGRIAILYKLPEHQFPPSILIGETSRYCDANIGNNLPNNDKTT